MKTSTSGFRAARYRRSQTVARKRSRGLGAAGDRHLRYAKQLLGSAWDDLERMPPTCEGGIHIAARALSAVSAAKEHLHSIEDEATREANSDVFGMANIADSTAWQTLQFFSQVCKAPHEEARERPLMSRRRAVEILHPPRKGKKR